MNVEIVGKLIKKIRQENNLTQIEFANKYGVTAQAVSKWEVGKNIPDIVILKQICNDYNISFNDMLDGKLVYKNNFYKNRKYILLYASFIVLFLFVIVLIKNYGNTFEFKTISASCDNFNISGSMAYSKSNSHLYLSNINYCGGNDVNNYKKIECILYEKKDNIKKELDKITYDDNKLIKLETFLKNIEFNLNDFSKACNNYNNDSLYLEINATTLEKQTINYQIPLQLNNMCKK